MKYNPRIDSLRAIAALIVVGAHWEGIVSCGWIGVQIFFVLSGFLITTILLKGKEEARSLPHFFGTFLGRRALRLLPAYALFVALLAGFYFVFREPSSFPSASPYLLTYTLNLDFQNIDDRWFGTLWSVAAEWQLYLVWALCVWLMSERQFIRFATILLLAVPLGRLVFFLLQGNAAEASRYLYVFPLNYADAFAIGALLTRERVRRWFCSPLVTSLFLGGVVAGGLLVLWRASANGMLQHEIGIRTFGYPWKMAHFHEFLWGYSLWSLAAATILAHTLAEETSRPSWWTRVVNLRFLQWIGTISYGVYIYHLPIVRGAMLLYDRIPFANKGAISPLSLAMLVPVIAVVLAVAKLSHMYWETYFLRKKSLFRFAPKAQG